APNALVPKISVPQTMPIALPEAAGGYGIVETRQPPELDESELRPANTVILSELALESVPLADQQTKILAPVAAAATQPIRERTQILTEAQLYGSEPVPVMHRARRLSIYEESTSVLSSTELDAETSVLDERALHDLALGDPCSEAVFLDEPDELA